MIRPAKNTSPEVKRLYINQGNMITASYLNFARICVLKVSRGLLTNHRGRLKKQRNSTTSLKNSTTACVPSNQNSHIGLMQRCLNRLTSSLTMVLQRALILTCEAPHPSSILGKVASGLCGDLLTCVLRAWDFAREEAGKRKKPVLLVRR